MAAVELLSIVKLDPLFRFGSHSEIGDMAAGGHDGLANIATGGYSNRFDRHAQAFVGGWHHDLNDGIPRVRENRIGFVVPRQIS